MADSQARQTAAEALWRAHGIPEEDFEVFAESRAGFADVVIDAYLRELAENPPAEAGRAVRNYWRSTPRAEATLEDALSAAFSALVKEGR